jgi:hypothetical protein
LCQAREKKVSVNVIGKRRRSPNFRSCEKIFATNSIQCEAKNFQVRDR